MTKEENKGDIRWPPLFSGTLVKRYKRFLADILLDNGDAVTAHCPNSGSMKSCSLPGQKVYASFHDNPKRKLKYTWELIEMPTSLVGVNTNIPNRLVKTAIENSKIKQLKGYDTITPEVKVNTHSRLDLYLQKKNGSSCYVEVKNCTLIEDGRASFPDAVTTRGFKHLVELQMLVKAGHRSVMFFLIQRMDAREFSPADHIDPDYGRELRKAHKKGVEICVYDVDINLKRIAIQGEVPFSL
ncbi:MAG: DNA/RNA nuclease SfsA [Proteobacteria bacterium]|nr:DNA/RNA nuclease SfsA [Pseudomonadota bacterium]